jgi:hypothetical protein
VCAWIRCTLLVSGMADASPLLVDGKPNSAYPPILEAYPVFANVSPVIIPAKWVEVR